MGIPIVQGRAFTDHDNASAPLAMIINQALAEQNFPGESPIGKRIAFRGPGSTRPPDWFEIVGVTANVRSLELREEPAPELYFSSSQDTFQSMSLVVRSTVEPESIAGPIREAVAEVDRTVPVSKVETMERVVCNAVTQPRFNLFLVGLFSVVALLLSAAGYGLPHTVAQRTHELSIAACPGAQVGDVLRMILREGMTVIVVGVALGLAAAFGLLRLMKSLLFGVSETDPLTYVGITLVLMLVALIACYIPARRATKVDPLEALRYE
jgi:putative ABC transport system permease protein